MQFDPPKKEECHGIYLIPSWQESGKFPSETLSHVKFTPAQDAFWNKPLYVYFSEHKGVKGLPDIPFIVVQSCWSQQPPEFSFLPALFRVLYMGNVKVYPVSVWVRVFVMVTRAVVRMKVFLGMMGEGPAQLRSCGVTISRVRGHWYLWAYITKHAHLTGASWGTDLDNIGIFWKGLRAGYTIINMGTELK